MIQFIGVEEEHIRQMAALLTKRHERERQKFPFLPARFEELDEAEPVIRNLLERPNTGGIVALRGIEVIGFMIYEYKKDDKWGRCISMDYSGVAISRKEHPRLLRMLYAEAGAEWVKHGCFHHMLSVPLGNEDELTQWLEQGFSYEQKYAVLPLESFQERNPTHAVSLNFRRASNEDAGILRKMAAWNSIHQASAPSWLPITKEGMEEVRQAYAGLSGDENAYLWLAEQKGQVSGFHVYFPKVEQYNLIVPPNCAELPAASTNPSFRGRGIGTALANHCFTNMKQEGFDYILADWHTPNHLASYFWPRLGFKPVMARLTRKLDPRIEWAHGK